MEIFDFNGQFFLSIALYFINCAIAFRYLVKKSFIVLIIWPVVIYSIGPLLSQPLKLHPVLSRYVFPDQLLEESEIFSIFMITIFIFEEKYNIGTNISRYVLSQDIFRIGASKSILFAFYVVGTLCAALQIVLMATYGSIFSGNYVLSATTDASNGQILSWGFLAGLYELFFACTLVILIAKGEKSIISKESFFYIFVLALRLFGGTRLILLKEISVIMFLMIVQKKVRPLSVVIISLGVISIGSVIGAARSGGEADPLGPLSSFYYETALNALTLNIADSLSHNSAAFEHYHPIDTTLNLALSIVPSFVRTAVTGSSEPATIPMVLDSGFDSPSPVGGMSLFASAIYLFYNPWIGPTFFPTLLLFISKTKFNRRIKSYVMLSIITESMNMWRDPFEISFKIIVQTVIFLYFMDTNWVLLVRSLGKKRHQTTNAFTS